MSGVYYYYAGADNPWEKKMKRIDQDTRDKVSVPFFIVGVGTGAFSVVSLGFAIGTTQHGLGAFLFGALSLVCWAIVFALNRRMSTGNAAFERYRAETLERLKKEEEEFVEHLDRLSDVADQAAFDKFMASKNK